MGLLGAIFFIVTAMILVINAQSSSYHVHHGVSKTWLQGNDYNNGHH